MPSRILHFRVTDEQGAEIEARAKAVGYEALSPYLRDRALGLGETRDEFAERMAEEGAEIIVPESVETIPVTVRIQGGGSSANGPVIEQPGSDSSPSNEEEKPEPETREDFIERRTRYHCEQGSEAPVAAACAEQEWDAAQER